MSLLRLHRIAKSFRKDKVLEDLSLDIEQGETLAVFGASGAGKTVLLRLIAGILRADAGGIYFAGRRIDGQPPEARGFGMAFQNFALYPHLSAFDNIASPLRAVGKPDGEIRSRVDEVARLLKIDHVLGHLPKELSNGQKQRCSLARALAPSPKLLMLDDPLRNVDAKLRYEMRLELPRVLGAGGTTVIFVTQDYKEAMALGDRVAVLIDGGIAQIGTPVEIYNAPAHRDVARLFGDPTINLVDAVASDGRLSLFDGLITLPSAHDGRLQVGIRPEHIEVDIDNSASAFPVELDAVTPLNVRAVLLLRTAAGDELLASCSEDEAARFGRGHRQVYARIEPKHLHLFDADGGAHLGMAA